MKEFNRICEKKERLIIGVMSGTSLDGVDLALVRLQGSGPDVKMTLSAFKTYPMTGNWRKRIRQSFEANTEEICKINFDLGKFFGDLINSFCQDLNINTNEIDAIGCHGQTLFHVHQHSTLQCGEADVIAQLTGTIVISDFRTADIAAGGTGAPLVPYLDWVMFQNANQNVALLNIGGIGNVTFIPKNDQRDILAFDTGPANAILNEMVEIMTHGQDSFDRDGYLSKKGSLQPAILDDLLKHDYFSRPLPKSTGREEFGKNFVQSLIEKYPSTSHHDLLRTLISLITHSITDACQRYLPTIEKLYASGGGIHHPLIYSELEELLGKDKIEKLNYSGGITADSKEAVAFALLAHERLNGVPTNIPSVTGAKTKTALGKISIPINIKK